MTPLNAKTPLSADRYAVLGNPVTAALVAGQPEGDVAGDVEVGEQCALLGDVAHPAGLRWHRSDPGTRDDGVTKGDGPAVGDEEPGDETQQRGLAAA